MLENNKSLLWGVGVLALVVVVAFVAWHGGRNSISKSSSNPTASSTQAVAEDVPHYPSNISTLGGKITAINGNTVNLDGVNMILIDGSTELYQQGAEKGEVAYEKELDAFLAIIKDYNRNPNVTYVGPDRFVHEPVALKDLRVGDNLFVTPLRIEGESIVALRVMVTKPTH